MIIGREVAEILAQKSNPNPNSNVKISLDVHVYSIMHMMVDLMMFGDVKISSLSGTWKTLPFLLSRLKIKESQNNEIKKDNDQMQVSLCNLF